jgi:CrcB protein
MKLILSIAAGGSLGAVGRFMVARALNRFTGTLFPWGTLTVNIIGSLLIGFFFEFFDRSTISPENRALITIGFLGSFTTFSTYSLESVNLVKNGEFRLAAANVAANNIVGILAVIAGIMASRVLFKFMK